MKLAFSIPDFSNIDTGNPMLTPLPEGVPTGGLGTTGADAIRVFIYLILAIAILTALWFIVKGAIDIIQSEGQKEKLKSGRERVIFAVFGLIMVFGYNVVVSMRMSSESVAMVKFKTQIEGDIKKMSMEKCASPE